MARTKAAARKRVGKPSSLPKSKSNAPTSKLGRPPTTQRPEQTEYDETIALRDPTLLSDTFSQAIKRHYGDSTSLEQGDLHLPPRAFRDTTAFGNPRVAKEIPEYLKTFLTPNEDPSTCSEAGAPHTLVIASSGIRVADLVRELRVFAAPTSAIGKFFAKHMKLHPNIEFAKKTKIGIAVGTPVRLRELIENEAIKVGSLERIVIDGSYQNDKKQTIYDMLDSFKPMTELLNVKAIKVRLLDDNDGLQVMVF